MCKGPSVTGKVGIKKLSLPGAVNDGVIWLMIPELETYPGFV